MKAHHISSLPLLLAGLYLACHSMRAHPAAADPVAAVPGPASTPSLAAYFDPTGHDDALSASGCHARYLYCANGSHFALYDDQKTYFGGLLAFIRDVDAGRF